VSRPLRVGHRRAEIGFLDARIGANGGRRVERDDLAVDHHRDLVGKADLLTAAAVLRRSVLFIGNDTGLMHLAAAAGVPTLGLFGPSPIEQYAPWGAHTATVSTAIPFRDLFGPNFNPLTTDTLMDSLSVDAAEEGARRLWARVSGKAA